MFRAKLTISKVAQVKRPACWPGVFVCGTRIRKAAPANEKSGVTEGFWQSAISKAVCWPGFFKGVVDE
jgi:hypothetical protein